MGRRRPASRYQVTICLKCSHPGGQHRGWGDDGYCALCDCDGWDERQCAPGWWSDELQASAELAKKAYDDPTIRKHLVAMVRRSDESPHVRDDFVAVRAERARLERLRACATATTDHNPRTGAPVTTMIPAQPGTLILVRLRESEQWLRYPVVAWHVDGDFLRPLVNDGTDRPDLFNDSVNRFDEPFDHELLSEADDRCACWGEATPSEHIPLCCDHCGRLLRERWADVVLAAHARAGLAPVGPEADQP